MIKNLTALLGTRLLFNYERAIRKAIRGGRKQGKTTRKKIAQTRREAKKSHAPAKRNPA